MPYSNDNIEIDLPTQKLTLIIRLAAAVDAFSHIARAESDI